MPRLDGMAASHRLKSDPRTRYTPIILLTANPLKAVQRGALDQGVDEFLTKPCVPEDLERQVQRLISRPTREAV